MTSRARAGLFGFRVRQRDSLATPRQIADVFPDSELSPGARRARHSAETAMGHSSVASFLLFGTPFRR
jgi:hypothetical protein